jgi:hypothetical protein
MLAHPALAEPGTAVLPHDEPPPDAPTEGAWLSAALTGLLAVIALTIVFYTLIRPLMP